MITTPGKYNIKELVLESRSGAVIDVTRFAANLVICSISNQIRRFSKRSQKTLMRLTLTYVRAKSGTWP